jgi:hypothetical protein
VRIVTIEDALGRVIAQLPTDERRELLDYGYWLLAQQTDPAPPMRLSVDAFDLDSGHAR